MNKDSLDSAMDTVSDALQRQMIAFIRSFGLHQGDRTPCGKPVSVAEAHALLELSQHGPLAQRELGAWLRLEKSTVSRLLAHLEQRARVVREPDQADKRVQLVQLTAEGQRIAADLAAARRMRFTRLVAALPPEQQASVLAALAILWRQLMQVGASVQRRNRRVAGIVGVLVVIVLAASAWVGLRVQTAREDEVAARGVQVMPFDLERTTHVFETTADDGVQQVRADDPNDTAQIALIRSHLKDEASKFQRGDFSALAAIHGAAMPGLAQLEQGAAQFTVVYIELPDGAQIHYTSDDPALIAALHAWFNAQLSDHGDDATDHSGH
jgi:DNA-binding MarR family transcriptional regulator